MASKTWPTKTMGKREYSDQPSSAKVNSGGCFDKVGVMKGIARGVRNRMAKRGERARRVHQSIPRKMRMMLEEGSRCQRPMSKESLNSRVRGPQNEGRKNSSCRG